jgi:hypothetical protein
VAPVECPRHSTPATPSRRPSPSLAWWVRREHRPPLTPWRSSCHSRVHTRLLHPHITHVGELLLRSGDVAEVAMVQVRPVECLSPSGVRNHGFSRVHTGRPTRKPVRWGFGEPPAGHPPPYPTTRSGSCTVWLGCEESAHTTGWLGAGPMSTQTGPSQGAVVWNGR